MAKGAYVGVSGKARKVSNIYVGVNGRARKVVKGYVGVNGVARQFWPGGLSISGWKQSTLPGSKPWTGIAYGNGKFVAVESGGMIAYSSDGKSWSSTSAPSGCYPWGITFGNGKFVVASFASKIGAYSTNGTSWTPVTLPSPTTAAPHWKCCAYGGGKYVMLAEDRSGLHSADGINWTLITLPQLASYQGIAYGDGKFIATSAEDKPSLISSDGGASWSTLDSLYGSHSDIAYGGGEFVTANRDQSSVATAEISTDGGTSWKSKFFPTPQTLKYGMAYGDGFFVTVGHSMVDSANGTDVSYYRPVGGEWAKLSLPTAAHWIAAAYGDGKFVAISGYNGNISPNTSNIAAYTI